MTTLPQFDMQPTLIGKTIRLRPLQVDDAFNKDREVSGVMHDYAYYRIDALISSAAARS